MMLVFTSEQKFILEISPRAKFRLQMMDKAELYALISASISIERLEAYSLPQDSDQFVAIGRYVWNTALCEALYPSLQCFEVLLRNAIHRSMSDRYGERWFDRPNFLRSTEFRRLLEAKDELGRQGKPTDPPRIVAELAFGFWTGLFVVSYEQSIANVLMKGRLHGVRPEHRTRRKLYDQLDRIRYLRNRVFHHEPIWHWSDLSQRHVEIIEFIGYISPVNKSLCIILDRFDSVFALGWEPYLKRIETEVIAPIPNNNRTKTVD